MGSEMCIRDRDPTGGLPSPDPLGPLLSHILNTPLDQIVGLIRGVPYNVVSLIHLFCPECTKTTIGLNSEQTVGQDSKTIRDALITARITLYA